MTGPAPRRGRALIPLLILIAMGAGWGMTQPLSKIAVSTGHQHFGLIFWQQTIGAVLMAVVILLRGATLPLTAGALRVYVILALLGTIIPNAASYQAIAHLPSGVVSILLSLVPMLAFPMALGLGLERFSLLRLMGLLAGLAGVLMLVLPETSLPDRAMLGWIPIALIAPLFYALEGNYVGKWGIGDLDPVQALFGASVVGALIALPLALAGGQFIVPPLPLGAPEWALIASSIIHVGAYASYVWLIGHAGTVFAAQVGYLVTGFGVFWAILMLGESYAPTTWLAMALVFLGVFLVQPRKG